MPSVKPLLSSRAARNQSREVPRIGASGQLLTTEETLWVGGPGVETARRGRLSTVMPITEPAAILGSGVTKRTVELSKAAYTPTHRDEDHSSPNNRETAMTSLIKHARELKIDELDAVNGGASGLGGIMGGGGPMGMLNQIMQMVQTQQQGQQQG